MQVEDSHQDCRRLFSVRPAIVLFSWRAQLILAPRDSIALPRRGEAQIETTDRFAKYTRRVYLAGKLNPCQVYSPVIRSSLRRRRGMFSRFPQDPLARVVRLKIITLIKEPRESERIEFACSAKAGLQDNLWLATRAHFPTSLVQ